MYSKIIPTFLPFLKKTGTYLREDKGLVCLTPSQFLCETALRIILFVNFILENNHSRKCKFFGPPPKKK